MTEYGVRYPTRIGITHGPGEDVTLSFGAGKDKLLVVMTQRQVHEMLNLGMTPAPVDQARQLFIEDKIPVESFEHELEKL